jgi:hypothetical protein
MKFLLSLAALTVTCNALAQGTSEAILSYADSISGYADTTVGWTFQTTNSFTVTDLGCFAKVFSDNPAITSVQVGLWDDSGLLLASNSITPSSMLFDETRYQPITITQARFDPGTYHLGVYPFGGGISLDVAGPSTGGSVSASPGMEVTGVAIATDGGFAYPSTVPGTAGSIYAGPNFRFLDQSINPGAVTNLYNAIPYTNTLPAYSAQYFIVQVPSWATRATNVLQFADKLGTATAETVTVLFNQTKFPATGDPLLMSGTAPLTSILSTKGTPPLVLAPGQTYYLALTNANAFAVTFSIGVWFDVTTVANLVHGIPYTNSLVANSVNYFVVQVPPWATRATNVLEFAEQVQTASPSPVTVFFNQTNFPTLAEPPFIGPNASSGTTVLYTNGTPPLLPGQTYCLALTNPNPFDVTFAIGVWFDITTLTNCELLVSNVVGLASIPRYFQFDVPTDGTNLLQSISFWLSGAPCGVQVVLSEHLPLPDLSRFDDISQGPCTNDLIVMFVTNSTPAARWYVGVFNSDPTNVTFSIQACAAPLPVIIPLTNGVPFVVASVIDPNAASPGPPQRLFFDFLITNSAPGALLELYNLSGDADLVLQRDVPPMMTPYFGTSFFTGTTREQIVLRTNSALPASYYLPDLRGHWYLGLFNNDKSNVSYTIRAVLPDANGLLVSGQPFLVSITPPAPPRGLVLSWSSVVGERYFVQSTPSLAAPAIWTNLASIVATNPLTTFEVLPAPTGTSFYRVLQGSPTPEPPRLSIQFSTNNQVRLSWSTAYPGYTLQSENGLTGKWANAGLPVNAVGSEYVAFDVIGPVPKYYRLIK